MSELREAAQAVVADWDDPMRSVEDMEQVIDRLRAALAQPESEAEPVAWQIRWICADEPTGDWVTTERPEWYRHDKNYELRPLYAHPPRDEWRTASEPPEDGRVVVVWRQSGLWDSAIWFPKAGAWENDYGVIRDVTHWRDVSPPAEGAK